MNSKFLKLFLLITLLFYWIDSDAQIKVACVGNSITLGSRLGSDSTYPQYLQKFLGSDYIVKNFGVSGATVKKGSDISYWGQSKYTEVLAWQPDIVIIKLGSNDAKIRPSYWESENVYYKDYSDFITSFRQLASNPVVYICYPIPVFEDKQYDISDSIMRMHIIPNIKKLARKTDANLIDLYSPFMGRKEELMYKQNDNKDWIHPNTKGAKVIAEEIYKMLILYGL